MNAYLKNSTQMVGRTGQFLADHATILTTPAQALVPKVVASLAEINQLGGGQFAGYNQYLSGAALRRQAAKQVRRMLVDIAQTARVLDQAGTHPGLAEKLHTSRDTRSYQALHDAGTAFAEELAVPAVKTSYTTRGYEATFIDDLTALVQALDTATTVKLSGANRRINSTASLTVAVRKGVAVVRDLDAILTRQLRNTEPGLYAEWKATIHIQSRPRQRAAAQPAVAKASTPPAEPPAPAPAEPEPVEAGAGI
jgi:hypothetical protein